MYVIYLDRQPVARAQRFAVLPSGDLQCREEFGGKVLRVIARGSWDHVAWDGDE